MTNKMARLLFAAPKSGNGKTMITCGFIEAMNRRGKKTAGVKCGPDYIDPMFHRRALGVPSGNLDTFFTGKDTTRYLLAKRASEAELTVLEGVMGYYDGLGGQSEAASTYEIAKVTETPVVLIVDGKGASVSLAAVIKGLMEYRRDSNIQGVLLNRVSAGYYDRLKALIEQECGVTVVGYLPECKALQVPSRHLGLVSPQELTAFQDWVGTIAEALEQTVDLDGLIRLAETAPELAAKEPFIDKLSHPVRIAVARDEAFSFYYEENLELLCRMGAELVEFSPLHQDRLPEDIDGLLLGGGYPELFAEKLSQNVSLREAVRKACAEGLPCVAECGGFLYLQRELQDAEGRTWEMAGALSGSGYPTGKLCRFGYMTGVSGSGGLFGEAGLSLKGHEFHYWDCSENGDGFRAEKTMGGNAYSCMVYTGRMAAGFPHFYYYSNPKAAFSFLKTCESYRAGRRAKQRWDNMAKPIAGLGQLEEYVTRLCAIQGSERIPDIKKRALAIFCGDHGVVAEGVTQTGSEVTRTVAENFAKGCSTVNYMAEQAGVDVFTFDVGMDTESYPEKRICRKAVIDRKVAKGCGNIAVEPAMTIEQCRQALACGQEAVSELKRQGYRILATGEMGIGNTTPTSALAGLFFRLGAEEVTGRGAGLSDEGLLKKRRVVQRVMDRVLEKGLVTERGITDPLAVLAEAGCYEIAAMAGVFLGGAVYGVPVVIDGAISAIAALVANAMDSRVADVAIASHESEESTEKLALEALGVKAILHGGMHLGEGTGAIALFPLLDMAVHVYECMGSFEEYGIEAYQHLGGESGL